MYLDSVAFFCVPGRELPKTKTSGALIQCLATGKWEAKPTCALTNCGQPAATVANGKIAASTTTFGSSATVTCSSKFKGGGSFNCGAYGQWASAPACTRTCPPGTLTKADKWCVDCLG